MTAEANSPLAVAGPGDLAAVAGSLPRRVALRGRWLHDKTVWVGNRIVDGRPGLYAVSPLQIEGDGAGRPAVLVNRGWMARGPTGGGSVPKLPVSSDEAVELVGLAVAQVPRILDLGDDTAPRDLASVWPNLDYRRYEQASGLKVAEFVVQQTSETADGLTRKWQRPATGVDKHRGYAFQWYALATLIAVLSLVFGTRAWRRARAGEAREARRGHPHREGV